MKNILPTAITLIILMVSHHASSQSKIFLNIDGIQGESSEAAHKDWIDVISFQQGVSSSSSSVTGAGGGAGKASFQDLKIVKHIDRATPQLLLFTASGRHITTGTLEMTVNSKFSFLITLKDISVTSVITTSQDGNSQEEVRLSFGNITCEVRENGASYKAGWDLKTNQVLP